ncbi:MAG TPA: hypothetical protein VF627_13565 [Abditibacterium sp.]
MAHIYSDGNVLAHISGGDKEPAAQCFDARDESFRTVVVIDLLSFLPLRYHQDEEDHNLPAWKFVIEAMESCATHEDELWAAWENLRNEEEL